MFSRPKEISEFPEGSRKVLLHETFVTKNYFIPSGKVMMKISASFQS